MRGKSVDPNNLIRKTIPGAAQSPQKDVNNDQRDQNNNATNTQNNEGDNTTKPQQPNNDDIKHIDQSNDDNELEIDEDIMKYIKSDDDLKRLILEYYRQKHTNNTITHPQDSPTTNNSNSNIHLTYIDIDMMRPPTTTDNINGNGNSKSAVANHTPTNNILVHNNNNDNDSGNQGDIYYGGSSNDIGMRPDRLFNIRANREMNATMSPIQVGVHKGGRLPDITSKNMAFELNKVMIPQTIKNGGNQVPPSPVAVNTQLLRKQVEKVSLFLMLNLSVDE